MPTFGKRQATEPAPKASWLCVSPRLELPVRSFQDVDRTSSAAVVGFTDNLDRFCEAGSDPQITFVDLMQIGAFASLCWFTLLSRRYFRRPDEAFPHGQKFGPETSIFVMEHLEPEVPSSPQSYLRLSCNVFLSDDDAERLHDKFQRWGSGSRRLLLACETEPFDLPRMRKAPVLTNNITQVAQVLPKWLEIRTC
jgi:hypothetical protein